ncbi:hypothetical protein tb265_19940 [Gemmatimonadetes bacterium T265]|nr:hypothetical protein tb265_19940 [Gemmatimonadetes bacterium T265]
MREDVDDPPHPPVRIGDPGGGKGSVTLPLRASERIVVGKRLRVARKMTQPRVLARRVVQVKM